MSFFRSRQNDVYGVDGMGRGLRWDARNYKMEPIGLRKPAIAPSIAKDSTATQLRLAAIQVQEVGTGYTDIPTTPYTSFCRERKNDIGRNESVWASASASAS